MEQNTNKNNIVSTIAHATESVQETSKSYINKVNDFAKTKKGRYVLTAVALLVAFTFAYTNLWIPAWDVKKGETIPFAHKWSAATGDRYVQYVLAVNYKPNSDSGYINSNADKYERWLLRSANNGYNSAKTDYILFGVSNHNKEKFAKELENDLSDNPRVLHALALLYSNKKFSNYDPYKAFSLVRKAAYMGDYKAMKTLGEWYIDSSAGVTNILLGSAWVLLSGQCALDSEHSKQCQQFVADTISYEGYTNPKGVADLVVKQKNDLKEHVFQM